MDLDPRSLEVYVVTSADLAGRDHGDVASAALEGGATALQLRAPELDDQAVLPLAVDLAARCRDAGVLFVVNDRVDVALASGAAGVHVGQDEDAGRARRRLGPDRVLGVSVGGAAQARAAQRAGADYLGVTVWATATKPEARARGLDGLREVVVTTTLPVVGIGGVTTENAAQVLEAGAAGVAVISAVAAADDPVEAVRELRRRVDTVRRVGGESGTGGEGAHA
jgi:thiamine-phosphate pyrophosphorylase